MKYFFICLLLLFSFSVSAQVLDQKEEDFIDSLMSSNYKVDEPGAVILVAENGKPVFEKAYGMASLELGVPDKTGNLFAIGSMSKQFTAVCILKLAEEGKLSLQDDITKYLPGYNSHGRKITIENLLTHTSGITSFTEKPDFRQMFTKDQTKDEIKNFFMNDSLLFEPGTDWSYSNSGFFLLGMIVEKVSGEKLYNFMKENIFEPAGMKHTCFGNHDSVITGFVTGYNKAGDNKYKDANYFSWTWTFGAGQIISSAEDLLKWDNALYTNKIVNQKWLDKAWTSFTLKDGRKTNYGFGWAVGYYKGVKIIRHGGAIFGFLSDGIRIPSKHIYSVILSNFTGKDPGNLNEQIALKVAGIPLEKPAITSLPAAKLKEYTGVYEVHVSGGRVTTNSSKGKIYRFITESDDTLFSQNSGSNKVPIFCVGKDLFTYEGSYSYLKFNRENNGKIISITLYSEPVGYGPNETEPKTDKPLLKEKKEISLTVDQLYKFTGTYDFGGGFHLKIFIKEDKLYGQATGQQAFELFPQSENKFFLKVVDASIDFVPDESGKVTSLILHQNGDHKARKIE